MTCRRHDPRYITARRPSAYLVPEPKKARPHPEQGSPGHPPQLPVATPTKLPVRWCRQGGVKGPEAGYLPRPFASFCTMNFKARAGERPAAA
jgi:hypothetical protein